MNVKKNYNLVVVLLFHCTLLQNCLATHIETLHEILRFCNVNGHGYIALLDQGSKAYHRSMKLLAHDLRIKSFVNKDNLVLETMDTLIIQKDMSSLQFDEILEIMNRRKRQTSILVVEEIEVEEFKVRSISYVNINSHCISTFLLYHLEKCFRIWQKLLFLPFVDFNST